MGEIVDRRAETRTRLASLHRRLKSAESAIRGKASVFVIGSFGRCEASRYSDLDLFIVGKRDGHPGPDGTEGSLLKRLDEICVKADLIEVIRRLHIPDFSGDGRYLTHYSVHEFTKTLGTPQDDVTNTFTARVLLLLESRPLLGSKVYHDIVREVIDAYWRDYTDHKSDFTPAFLANDILRLWRTFCVNYEARTKRVPKHEKAKGKLKNYKLKHSRLLTCYSGLLYLLAVYRRKGTVSPEDAMTMVTITPTERLNWLLGLREISDAHDTLRRLLDQYERFLETTNADEEKLIARFMNMTTARDLMGDAYRLGDLVFKALTIIGSGNQFHRLLVV